MPSDESLIEEKFEWIFLRLNELKEDQRSADEEIKCRLQSLESKLLKLHSQTMVEAGGIGGVGAMLGSFLIEFLHIKGQ